MFSSRWYLHLPRTESLRWGAVPGRPHVSDPGPRLTLGRVVVANVPDGASHHPLVVHRGRGGDLAAKQHHARLTHCLCERGRKVGGHKPAKGSPTPSLSERVSQGTDSGHKRLMLTNRVNPSGSAEHVSKPPGALLFGQNGSHLASR